MHSNTDTASEPCLASGSCEMSGSLIFAPILYAEIEVIATVLCSALIHAGRRRPQSCRGHGEAGREATIPRAQTLDGDIRRLPPRIFPRPVDAVVLIRAVLADAPWIVSLSKPPPRLGA